MSLLMKALEKAAKDRTEASAEAPPPGAAPAAPGKMPPELTLEPVAQPAASAAAPERKPTPPANRDIKPAADPDARGMPPRDPAQAATVIRASKIDSKPSPLAYLRDRPLITFGVLAGLFLIGFGGYVYVEIMNPSLLASKPAPRPAPPAAQAPTPAAAPAPAVAANNPASSPTAPAATPAPPQPLSSLLPPTEAVAPKASVPTQPPAGPAETTPRAPTRAAAAAAAAGTTAATAPPAPALPPQVVAAPAMPRDTIKVTAATQAPSINPVLADAYSALNSGNLEAAQKLYNQLLKSDPRSTEALLGLAAIATQQGDRDSSMKNYIRVIELDPRNSLAQAGLLNVMGSADPASAETRVKQLIARDPNSAFLYFTLGNTYIDQSRWPDAQQAFFQAHHLQPDNPDYAYNLAIALEHIGQSKPALEYYRRAVQLATARGHSNFSPDAVLARINRLEKIVQ